MLMGLDIHCIIYSEYGRHGDEMMCLEMYWYSVIEAGLLSPKIILIVTSVTKNA